MAEIKIKGSIRARGKGFEYVVDVAPPGEKRNQKTELFDTREEAEAALIEINNRLKLGQKFTRDSTLKTLITNFYERQVKPKVRDTTYITQTGHVKKITKYLGDKKIEKIDHEDIELFYMNLREREKLGEGTIRNISVVLRKTFSYALSRKYIIENIAKDVSAGSYKPKKMKVWLPEQVQIFLEYMEGKPKYPFFVLAFSTGMRIGEQLALRPSDLLIFSKQIQIERSLKYISGVGYIDDDPTKTPNSVRKIFLDPHVFQIVWSAADQNAKYLFHRKDGSFLRYRGMLEGFKRDAIACGLPPICLHEIRHTVATTLLSRGMDVTIVAEILGDTVQTVYATYAHVIPTMRSEAAGVLSDSFFKNVDKSGDKMKA